MTDKKTVVVFVDVQNDFIDGKLRNEEAIKRLPKVIEFAKSLGNGENYKVYATRDTHFESYLSDSLEGEKLPVEHCLINSDGWRVNNELAEVLDKLDCKYVNKFTFGSLDLPEIIAEDVGGFKNIDKIIVCGYVSSICVLANAIILRAAFNNTKIEVMSDLCAGITKADHNAAMTCLTMQQIDVVKFN